MKDFGDWINEMAGQIPDASHFVKPDFEVNQIASGTLTNEGTKMIGLTPGQKALKVADDAYPRTERLWFIAFQAEYSYALNPDTTLLKSLSDFLKLIVGASDYRNYAHHIEKYVGWNKL